MLKAQQNNLVQDANVNLIGIRSYEVQYFAIFFTRFHGCCILKWLFHTSFFEFSFGTLSALLGGLMIASIGQTPGCWFCNDDFFRFGDTDRLNTTGLDLQQHVATGWLYLYWLATAVGGTSSLLNVLRTTYCSIYGQALALRGPSGSMVGIQLNAFLMSQLM